jgi:hypothetical protein
MRAYRLERVAACPYILKSLTRRDVNEAGWKHEREKRETEKDASTDR